MSQVEQILIDNLKEALQATQQYMVLGVAAGLFLLLTAIQRVPGAEADATILIPGLDMRADAPSAILVAAAIYWITGLMASLTISRVQRIMSKLQPEVLDAALTYPSLTTIRAGLPRIGAAVLPAILVAVAVFFGVSNAQAFDLARYVLVVGLAAIPYLTLAAMLWRPLAGRPVDETRPPRD